MQVLPSPERACPDIDGGGEDLEGKSDIMPCNLFLRFSEAGKRRETKHPVMTRRRRKDGEAHSWTDETNVGRKKKGKKVQCIPSIWLLDVLKRFELNLNVKGSNV